MNFGNDQILGAVIWPIVSNNNLLKKLKRKIKLKSQGVSAHVFSQKYFTKTVLPADDNDQRYFR